MTAQIDDTFLLRGMEYAISGISEGELFDPAVLDLQPSGICSACWRGYQVVCSLSANNLVVANLHVNLLHDDETCSPKVGPSINGIFPTGSFEELDFFNNHYTGLNYHLEYTGGLLLADGFIEELYVHMGFHPPWKYESVIELVFENGKLVKESDCSARMAEIRALIPPSRDGAVSQPEPTDEQIRQFIDRAFDRSYDI